MYEKSLKGGAFVMKYSIFEYFIDFCLKFLYIYSKIEYRPKASQRWFSAPLVYLSLWIRTFCLHNIDRGQAIAAKRYQNRT